MSSRRSFLALTGGAIFAPSALCAQNQQKSDVPLVDQVPAMLDHILLGCNDLQRGIDFVEQHTGVRAAFGGVHPGRGTQNALLSLGVRRYLEIIAPDPQQTASSSELPAKLKKLSEPRLVGWAAHPGDLQVLAADLGKAGIAAAGPTPGSRKRPEGSTLQWKTVCCRSLSSGAPTPLIRPKTLRPAANSSASSWSRQTQLASLKSPLDSSSQPLSQKALPRSSTPSFPAPTANSTSLRDPTAIFDS